MGGNPRRVRGVPGVPLAKPLIALQAAITGDALIKAIITLLQRATRCDFVAVFLRIEPHVDGVVPYRMIDSRGRDFGPEMADGVFFRDHPSMPKLMANPGIKFITTRETLPPDPVLHAMPFYRDVMRVIGFRHSIAIYFWSDPPQIPEAVFSPCRIEGQPDFTDEDIAVLDGLYPHIDAALRRVRAIAEERAVRAEMHGLVDRTRPACVLNWDLTVAEENRAAREMCARWNLGDKGAHLKPPPFVVPEPLRAACTELKKRWGASLQHHPATGAAERMSVVHPDRAALSATVSVHVRPTESLGKPALLIEFEPPKDTARGLRPVNAKADLRSFSLQERALIGLVREGKSNQEIATETGKALGSVKNALHAIFRKTNVRSRSALIARLDGGLHASASSRRLRE